MLAVALLCVAILPCCTGVQRDLSNTAPYSEMVGRIYRVVGAVEGLAIRPFGANDPAYISLWPTEPNKYTGTEIVFRRPIAAGAKFKIVGAEVNDTIADDSYFYVVEFESPIDPQLPVRLNLYEPFGGKNGSLNPQYFERVE